eukprot:3492531-Rhodomonas_salina.1
MPYDAMQCKVLSYGIRGYQDSGIGYIEFTVLACGRWEGGVHVGTALARTDADIVVGVGQDFAGTDWPGTNPATPLRAPYDVSGTDIAASYEHPTACPVLSERMLLPGTKAGSYALCGRDG